MAKNVFRPQEVVNLTSRVHIETPFEAPEEPEIEEVVEEYTGPTADDFRREAEAFKESWETEKARMIEESKAEAERIVKDAEETAFREVREKTARIQKEKQETGDESKRILEEARKKAEEERERAANEVDTIRKNAHQEGIEKGMKEGFESGEKEVQRLIDHLHSIISKAIEKRNEIIQESETQLINLVLLISKKVIKVISENQKNVVVNNVIQALRKLKSRGDVVIRVNLEDVELTSDHVKDFMRMVENVRSLTVLEDSTVDRGGCIIETDFGQIDARISSQFKEIEEKIIEISPIKMKGE
ncbi:MAG: flagellar assembly protein FliH [Spirochaetales bacterium]|nr:flagellar assembly protein FliH [Spirochaetales bacterium]